MMRIRPGLFAVALGVFATACGDEPPPDRAIRENQIRRTVVSYNIMAVSGQAEEACALLTDKARTIIAREVDGPNTTEGCVSFWTRMGRIPAVAEPVKAAQVASVAVTGERATATYATGGTVKLIWSEGRWLLN